MSSLKSRKACTNCYQKKVRCDWQEGSSKCTFCKDHDLECSIPESSNPPQRTAIRETLKDIESRLKRLESNSSASRPPSHSPNAAAESRYYERLASSTSPTYDAHSETTSHAIPSRVRLFRGPTSPWTMLADGLTASSASDQNDFTKNISSLADDENTATLKSTAVRFDLLSEFPNLTAELVLFYSKNYASEAPFPTLYWPNLEILIQQGITSQTWSNWGEIVCVLLYMAFGVSRVGTRPAECDVYFKKAWSMVPHLLMEQNVWALKGLTLMVHYLQGGSLPEPCYALLGTASRVAINLGFHTNSRHNDLTEIEEEEGRRSWWLCYIMEKTLSAILGRPSMNIDATIRRPCPFRRPLSPDTEEPDDQEAVLLFNDIITLMDTREQIMNQGTPSSQSPPPSEDLLSSYKQQIDTSLLLYPLQPSQPSTLRTTILSLSYNNTLLLLSHHLLPFPNSFPTSILCAARTTIIHITETHTAGLTMCLWMWLYYAFTACVILFLSILQNPLHEDVALNLALIGDIENVCRRLEAGNPGASRVMECTREMGRVAVEVMKRRAKGVKRKAESLHAEDDGREKMRRVDIDGEEVQPGNTLTDTPWEDSSEWADLPANFAWDEWVQFLAENMPPEGQ